MSNNNFFATYSQEEINKFMKNLKTKELSKNPDLSSTEFMLAFMSKFPIKLLSDYNDWLFKNYDIKPKNN